MDKPDMIPLGSVTTITTEGAGRQSFHACDDCRAVFATRRAASHHTRAVHRAMAAFGPAADAIRERRAEMQAEAWSEMQAEAQMGAACGGGYSLRMS